jgi:ubiquitin-conjugating enzyme E2 Z
MRPDPKIRHETLRISVIQRLEEYLGLGSDAVKGNPVKSTTDPDDVDMDSQDVDEASTPFEPFKDLCKQRFLWYYDSYLATIQKARGEVMDGQPFTKMPFEGGGNSMAGKFNYTELERRIRRIKMTLDQELIDWAAEGAKEACDDGTTIAVNLHNQYSQIVESFKRDDIPHHLQLEDGNPFVWLITYFGAPMSNLDGGLLRFRMHFSPRFPSEQPRVCFETKIFHHRIAADGTVCYFPSFHRREDVRSHIDAVFASLEEEEPAYDPRTIVNPEAHTLFWGKKPEDRKAYSRKLRRSVQRSME